MNPPAELASGRLAVFRRARPAAWPRGWAGIAALGLTSLIGALFAARIGGDGTSLWFYDVPKVFYPNAVFWHEAVRAGGIPLWIDRLGLGFPIYAEGQIGSFYLPNLLLGLLPPVTAMDVGRVLHLAMAGAGAGLIVRRLGGTWAGACVAALGAVLGGGIVGKLEWTSLVTAYAWAPWVFLPLVGRHEVSRLGLIGAGIAWGIQGLAAHPNTWVLTGICAAVLLLASDPRAASLRRLAIFGALGLAVSAVQLLPSLVLLSLSTRAAGLPAWDLFSNSATPLDVLLPGFSHAFVRSLPGEWDFAQQWYPGGLWGLHEANVYLGLPMLALAGLGAMARRSRPFLIAGLVMVGIAVIGALEPALWLQTPILNGLRHPVRAYMLAGLMASIVAGIGVSRATLPRVSLRPAIALVLGSIVAYLVVLALVVDLPDLFRAFAKSFLILGPDTPEHFRAKAEPALTAPDPVVIEVAFGLATLGLLAIAPRLARRPVLRGVTIDRRAVRVALVGLVALPLIAYSPAANAQKPFDQISHAETPYMRAVMAFEPRRFLALIDPNWYDGIPNQLASAGFTELGMWSSLNLSATDELVKAIRFPEAGGTDATLARAAGVDVMATFDGAPCPGTDTLSPNEGPTSVCRLEAAPRPPYWIPLDAVGEPIEPPPAPLLARLLGPLGSRPVDRPVDAGRAVADAVSATVRRWDDGGAEVVVEAPADGWVYLDRAWWPAWRVTVDGEPVVPDRGLGGQLVRVSAGMSVIQQSLVPTEALLGLVVGIAGIVAALAWALPWRRAAAVRRRSWRDGLPAPKPKADPDPEPERDPEPEPDPESPDAGPDAPHSNRPWDLLPWTISFRGLSPLRLAIGGAILALDLLVVAWLIPLTAIVIAWPLLFAIPGWWLVSRVAPNLSPPGRLGLAVVSSVYISAHLVNVVSLVAGFGRFSVLVAVGLLALATAVLATQRLPWLAPPPPLPSGEGIRAALRGYSPAFVVAGAVALVVLLTLALNGWHQTPQGWISGGWNWSDLLVHVSIGSSILHGNFPPQVPYFAGVPLTYHWFADFHGAIAASAAGVDIIGVYFVTSALFAGMLALLVWELARQLTGNRRVATIAAILVCFGGGMGWLRLGADILAGNSDVVGLVTANPYDNSWADGWPWFRIPSVLGTGFLPHRASTLGFPGFVGAILLVVTCLGRRPAGVLLAGVLAALLAPFQFYAFPATYLVVLLYVLATRAWRAPTFRRDAVLFLAPIVLALPFIAGAIFQQGERGAFHPVAIWSEARPNEGPLALLFFYVTNLGVPFLLALGAIGLAAWRRRFTPTLLFLAAWLVALFVVPNVVVVSAVEFDMNKYFQMMWFAVAILAAWLIRDWRPRAIAVVLAVAAISPALIAMWHSTNPALVLTVAGERAGRWIERNTPERAVFVTDAFINSPVDISGRLRLTTFGPYAANLGYDPSERERDIKVIYCAGPDVAAELMVRHGATYVLSSGGLLICDSGGPPTDFRSSDRFERVYDQDGVAVFRLVKQ